MARGTGITNRGSTQRALSLLTDFRYQMSFEPYNAFYLPLLATPEELRFWEATASSALTLMSENAQSRELFMKTCALNLDQKAMHVLLGRGAIEGLQYVNDLMGIVEAKGSRAPQAVVRVARKIEAIMKEEVPVVRDLRY